MRQSDSKEPGPTAAPALDISDRRALAVQYTPYVRHIAARIKRRMPREIEFDDLVEYGMVGLLEAADRFDPARGINFTTFAFYRVRGAIYDGLRGMGWLNRGEYARLRFETRANAYLEELAQAPDDGGDPGHRGTAGRGAQDPLEHAVQHLATAVGGLATVYITSLDAAATAALRDEQQLAPEEFVGLEEQRSAVRRIIKKLPQKERDIVQMFYYSDMSLEQIGQTLGLSKSWMSRLHARIVDKLHRMLEL